MCAQSQAIVSATEKVLQVALPHDPYPIVIQAGGLQRMGQWVTTHAVRPGSRVLLVSNPVVHEHYGERVEHSLREAGLEVSSLVLEAGEDQKTLSTVATIYDAAQQNRLERSSLLVALGGGWWATWWVLLRPLGSGAWPWSRCPQPSWPWWMRPSVARRG